MPTPVPPLLDPYVQPQPQGSLTLVTSVLDATSNWLLLRIIYAGLHGVKKPAGRYGLDATDATDASELTRRRNNVLFISFLRNAAFWRNEGKRLVSLKRTSAHQLERIFWFRKPESSPLLNQARALYICQIFKLTVSRSQGLDISAMIAQKRLIFVDGLSQLFHPDPKHTSHSLQTEALPKWTYTSVPKLQEVLASQVQTLTDAAAGNASQEASTIVIIDAPDVLLGTTAGASRNTTASEVADLCLGLRALPNVHSLVIALSGDQPFLHHSKSPTPIEADQKTCLISMAHQARLVLQLRPLDTGSAKDVSGVIRASRGGAWEEIEEETWAAEGPITLSIRHGVATEREWLYYVAGNGEAKVWGRGETGLT